MTLPDVQDAAPAEAAKWRYIRRRCLAVFQAHGYREVEPAPIEPPGSARLAGAPGAVELTDGTELRSDPLASIARTFIGHADEERFARWMTTGPVYDVEPVGALRTRAWLAASGLILGASEPAADAEVAALCLMLASDIGLVDAEVVVGTVGEAHDVERFLEATRELRELRCADCKASTAPLRFLTCSDEGCLALTASAPPLRDFIGLASLKHHEAVLATLEASGFVVRDEPRLGFGAGRYNRTLVELRARSASGVITVARGGRRDGLVGVFGGRPTPAVGLSLGIGRTSACAPGEEGYESSCELFIASRGAGARAWALRAAAAERSRGFRVEVDLRDVGWAEQLQRAEKVRARVVLVVGDVERKKGEVAIRDMSTRETRHISEDKLQAELKRLLR